MDSVFEPAREIDRIIFGTTVPNRARRPLRRRAQSGCLSAAPRVDYRRDSRCNACGEASPLSAEDAMWDLFRQYYPYLAGALVATPLLLGDFALFILAMAAAIALVPCAYGRDVDEIVERTFERDER
jgi:hypothetical protein